MPGSSQSLANRPSPPPSPARGDNRGGNHVGASRAFLKILRFWLGTIFIASACGNVTFVPAPFAPRKIEVIYSQQEDLTAIRWRMSATGVDPSVGFELAGGHGSWSSLDFAASLYPGGVAPCGTGGGLCAQMVLPGRYQLPDDASTPVRSRNPTYDVSPGDTPTLEIYTQTLSLQSSFQRGNQLLTVAIDDVIGGDGTFVFPRVLQRSVWDRRGVCVSGFYPPEAQFQPVDGLNQPWPGPTPLSDTGRYCAGVRAVPASGVGSDDQIALDTVPDVFDDDMTYTVPTQMTPFTYQIVLDLSIPVADRCQAAIQTIQSAVNDTLMPYSALRALPVIDLSAGIDPETHMPGIPCRQSELRALDAAGLAQQVKLDAASWVEQHQRYFLLYFNNLRAALPDTLTQSLTNFSETLVTPPPNQDFQAILWPWGPPEMAQSFGGWTVPDTVWTSADDPGFVQDLKTFASQQLPLISEVQDPTQPVPLLNGDQAQQFDGGLVRLCTVSITPLQNSGLQMVAHDADGNVVYLPAATEYPVNATDPPAYLLQVPQVWAVSNFGFMAHQAHIQYEVCARYCDHGFTTQAGNPVTSGWAGSPYCLGPVAGGGQ